MPPPGATSAGDEVQPAVGTDLQVGDVERLTRQKRLHAGRVRSTVAFQLRHQDPAFRPVTEEQRVAITLGKHDVVVKHGAGGRRTARVGNLGQQIHVVVGPVGPAAAPAVLAARQNVEESRGTIPGRADVRFHVAVVDEQLALGAERQVVHVAQTARHQLHDVALQVGPNDHPAGRLATDGVSTRIFIPRTDQISFVVAAVGAGRIQLLEQATCGFPGQRRSSRPVRA